MIAALAVIALLIMGASVVASYFSLWTGIVQPARKYWAEASRIQRRGMTYLVAGQGLFAGTVAVLLIVAPFGSQTPKYVVGGVVLSMFVAVQLLAVAMARRDLRRKTR